MARSDLVERAAVSAKAARPVFFASGKTPEGLAIDLVMQPLRHHLFFWTGPGWLVSAIVRRPGHADSIEGTSHKRFEEAKRSFDEMVERWALVER